MGANQSSKSELPRLKTNYASGRSLGSSLRKGMGNVLNGSHKSGASGAGTKSGQTRSNNSKPPNGKQSVVAAGDHAANGSSQHSQSDPYYVSAISSQNRADKSFTAAMNNYVTMQEQPVKPTNRQQQQGSRVAAAALNGIQLDGNNNNGTGASGGVYGTGDFYTEPMEISACVREGSSSFSAQDHHHHHHRHQQANNESIGSDATTFSRSPNRQQLHHTTTTKTSSPFQLSRAVNSKTSSVLSNTAGVAMPAPNSGRRTQNLAQQQQQQQQTTPIANKNKLYPTYHSSPNHQLYNGGSYSSSSSSSAIRLPSVIDQQQQSNYTQDSENQQYRTRATNYKSPQHQYQYYNQDNPNISLPNYIQSSGYQQTSNNGAIDFHQATYNSNLQQQQQQRQAAPVRLDFDYNRSYSCLGSRTLDSKQLKKQSPLAAIFTPNNNNSKQSNTIHLGRRGNKWSNQQQANNQRSAPGSLKRIKSAPLTAQQATYEAMRTIDMYLIRQIARSCMDFEMEQKIDLEIRLRELAAQSMLEARNEIDVLEVEKSLLTSDQRMNCYASQLEQQRKRLSSTPSLATTDSGRGSKRGSRNESNRHRRQQTNARSDVIGSSSGVGSTSSPSFSSNSQSPSKLSPVSGESAATSNYSPTSGLTTDNNSASSNCSPSTRRHLKGADHSIRTHTANNTLNRSAKHHHRVKNKRREQLMQSITSLSNINCNMVVNNRASVSVSEIRIPLMWRDVDHFKNRGDYKRYAVFCLLKINSQIYDTQLISDVDRQVTDVTFDDLVVFNEIDHNFELCLEVYSCVYLEQFSFSSTPRKLKEKLTSSVSRAMGRRLATQTVSSQYTKELQAYDKSYRFAMIASAILRLDDASNSVKTYDLVLPSSQQQQYTNQYHTNATSVSGATQTAMDNTTTLLMSNSKDANNKNTLPLFGHFCCKLVVTPDVFDKNIRTGYLRVASISVPNDHSYTQTAAVGTTTMALDGRCSSQGSNSPLASSTNSTQYDSNTVESSSSIVNSPSSTSSSSATDKLRASAMAASSKMATLSLSSSSVHWGLLRNFSLHLWQVNEQTLEPAHLLRGELPSCLSNNHPRKPSISLSIDKYTRLLRVSNSSLTLETNKGCFVLAAYSPEAADDEIGHWLRAIEQLIYDSHIWGSVLNHYPPHIKAHQDHRRTSGSTSGIRSIDTHQQQQQQQQYRNEYCGGGILQADL